MKHARSRALALTVTGAIIAWAAPAGTRDLPLPGPAPRAPLAPVDGVGLPTDARCASCHAEIAAEWRASLHHRAWNNGYFPRSYAMEPLPFCRKCHAPSVDPAAEPPPEAKEAGVGCASCHVIPAGIVGARGQPARPGAHEVIGDARLATPAACGDCHDFPFPAPRGFDAGPMQDTLGEHRRSAASATACQGCHMPSVPSAGGGTHRSHAFKVQGDPAMLAQAVEVKRAELGRGEVTLEIAPGKIGHAFPTGDLFRQAEVRVTPVDHAGHAVAARAAKVLGRSFGPVRVGRDQIVQVQRSDTRISGPVALVIAVPPGTRRARWELVWQRLPPELAARLGMVMSEQEVVVTSGVVSR